jgi:hypothetical protein
MSNHKSNLSNSTSSIITEGHESWLTKQQAAQVLQVAEKTIDRMAKAGELHKEILKRPRQGPIVVFHPGDVHRAKAAREPGAPVPYVMPQTGVQRVSDLEAGQVSTRLSEMSKSDMSPSTSNVSRVRLPLWLTLQESVDYSGLPAAILLEFIAGGRLPALDVGRRRGGRWRIRKVDLRDLSTSPSHPRQNLLAQA